MAAKKTFRDRVLKAAPSLLCAVLLALTVCGYIPAVSYLSNVNFYSFNLGQLLLGMLLPFCCVAIGLAALLIALGYALQAKAPRLVYQTPKNKSLVSVFHVVLVLLVLCLWLEGSPLSRGLPQLTGETGIFSSLPRAVLDAALWLAILVLGLIFWRRLAKHYIYLLVAACLLLGLGVADATMNQQPKATLATATANEVLDRAAFSPDDNVLVLVLDAMSTAAVQDYLAENPTAQANFEGFTFFENNMESATSTQWSLPSILKGDIFTGGDVLEYQNSLFDAPESLVQKFAEAGYDVYASSTLPNYNRYMLDQKTQTSTTKKAISVPAGLYGQFWVRFSPYAFKNAVAGQAVISGTVSTTENLPGGNLEALGDIEPVNYDELAYRALAHAAEEKDSALPTFHFHHVNGAHMPYTIGSSGQPLAASERETLYGLHQQSAWTLQYVQTLLQALRDNELYDNTTIVLLGDHGDRLTDDSRANSAYAVRASLLIKPAGSTAPFATSAAPTSNVYLSDFLPAVQLAGETLDDLTAELPPQRQVLVGGTFIHVFDGADVTDLTLVERTPVEQEFTPTTLAMGTHYSPSTLAENANTAFPLDYENIDFSNGWGLRALGEAAGFSYLVDATPGQKLDLTLTVSTSSLKGGYPDFTPYELTVQDKTSGKEQTFTISASRPELQISGFEVSEAGSIELGLLISEYPDPATMQVSVVGIMATKASGRDDSASNALAEGTRYSLATKKENVPIATPVGYHNGDLSNGWGLRALREGMDCAFSVNSTPRQKLNVTLMVSTSALAGGYPDFEPYELTVRDKTSRKDYTFTMKDGRTEVYLDNVTVADDSTIQLAFSISKYPDPDTMQVSLVEIQIDNALKQIDPATALVAGTRYSLATKKEGVTTAYPLDFENADFSNGWGLRTLGNTMECAFLVRSAPGQSLDVTFLVSSAGLDGTYPDFEPYDLTVEDKVSGKKQVFTMDTSRMEVSLDGLTVSEDFSIQLGFTLSKHPDPDTMQVTVVEVQVDKPA